MRDLRHHSHAIVTPLISAEPSLQYAQEHVFERVTPSCCRSRHDWASRLMTALTGKHHLQTPGEVPPATV